MRLQDTGKNVWLIWIGTSHSIRTFELNRTGKIKEDLSQRGIWVWDKLLTLTGAALVIMEASEKDIL